MASTHINRVIDDAKQAVIDSTHHQHTIDKIITAEADGIRERRAAHQQQEGTHGKHPEN